MSSVRFGAEAEAELHDAVSYYDEIDPRLGGRLVEEVRAAVVILSDQPEIGAPYELGTRRVLLQRP